MRLAQSGYETLNSLIDADIQDLMQVRNIGRELARNIKEYVEEYIIDQHDKLKSPQIRRAEELGRDSNIISDLYDHIGDNFARAVTLVFKYGIGLSCEFIGDINMHEPDVLIEYKNEKIVIECKRKIGTKLVSAGKAEEILGKGAKYKPTAYVTIGFPDFAQSAIDNVLNTKITQITHSKLAELLLKFWNGELSQEEIIGILKSKKYIT